MGVADKNSELFDVVDENNQVIGQEQRGVVHRKGLLHRAVYCFVFNSAGELLIQRRSPHKSIGALQWDLSVAEHLEPGEGYVYGAARGLKEELSIEVEHTSELAGPLGPAHLRRLETDSGLRDYEFVQSFRLDGYEGKVRYDEDEVCDVAWVALGDLQADMAADPERYTPWFRDEIAALDWLTEAPPGTAAAAMACAADDG